MVLPYVQRPPLSYVPEDTGQNTWRYSFKENIVPYGRPLDIDFSFLIDSDNKIIDAINNIEAGVIVGADDPLSKFKFPTTDGAGNISWTFVQNQNIEDLAITASKLDAEAAPIGCIPMVTQARTVQYLPFVAKTSQIGDSAITTPKIANSAVTAIKMNSGTSAAGTVLTAQGAGASTYVPITASMINSGTSAAGTVLTAQGAGASTYQAIPATGKILQIKQYLENTIVSTPDSFGNCIPFTTPFTLSITPLSTTSIIQINISMNMSAFSSQSQASRVIFAAALYRNNLLWKKATGVPSEATTTPALFGGSTINEYIPLQNFSAALYDDTAHTLAPIKYEIKACCLELLGKVLLNTCFNKATDEYEGAVGVSSIVLTEIQL